MKIMLQNNPSLLLVGAALPFLVLVLVLWRHNRQLQRELDTLRVQDSLTGLYNRQHFMILAEREINRAQRTRHRACAMIIDLDGCKKLNEEYSHLGGDLALRALATAATAIVRDYDLVGRFSGEEIALLLPDSTREGAQAVENRLRERLTHEVIQLPDGRVFQISISVGVAELAGETEDIDDILLHADEALCSAKHQGPGHTAWHNHRTHQAVLA